MYVYVATHSGERHTIFLKFSPQEEAFHKTQAERAKQYRSVELRDALATLDPRQSERIRKMNAQPRQCGQPKNVTIISPNPMQNRAKPVKIWVFLMIL